jgi:hypothetical protein
MGTVVYTRAPTGPGRLQIFVGDFAVRAARPLTFTLDGHATLPTALRPFSSVRGPRHGAAPDDARAFVGVYEFRNLEPGRRYRVGVRLGETERRLDAHVLPDHVPSEEDGGFDVLLSSCFYRDEPSLGLLNRVLRRLLSSVRPKRRGGRSPELALLMGDQVYLDLPTLKDFPDDMPKLAQRFEDNYRTNWEGYLPGLLGAAPWACVPDDHEFWNNAPHPSPQIGNSYTRAGRRRWHEAASLCYEAFAQPQIDPALALVPAPPGSAARGAADQPLVIDVRPLSFFLADGRSQRDESRRFVFTPTCRAALRAWIDRINAAGRIGVFVSGQSLLRERVSHLRGSFADWEMPNYDDYAEVLGELGRARQRMLWLTGDVHWGRVCSLHNRRHEPRVQEVVVSPLSLVTTVGVDQAKLALNVVKGLFGDKDPWPLHSKADAPPRELALGSGADARLRSSVDRSAAGKPAQIIGNQLGLLSFDWTRGQLRAAITYFPVHEEISAPVRVPLFTTSIA